MDIVLLIIMLIISALLFVLIRECGTAVSIFGRIIICFLVILFVVSVVLHPSESFSSAFEGLGIWFNVVCPSLLPFFIGSELMISLGIAEFIGNLLEPVMRPLFNVPGCGSFPFVMSITSGYPVGAKVVSALYRNSACTRTEAQRMLSFCSTSGPLFMIGAVAVGMLHLSESGTVIAVANYIGAVAVGIIFRFYRIREKSPSYMHSGSIKRTFKKLAGSLKGEQTPFGTMLGSAVKNSVNTLLLIGGLIVLFSVIIRLLTLSGFISLLSKVLYILLRPIGIGEGIITASASGLFEITVGSKMISSCNAPVGQRIVAISGIIAWSGISVHAQVASIIGSTDLSFGTYVISKALHSMFAFIIAGMLISTSGMPSNVPVFGYSEFVRIANLGWGGMFLSSVLRYASIVAILFLLSFVCRAASRSLSAFNR